MAILINLLPDVRQAKVKEAQRRQLVTAMSVILWVVCGGLIVLLSVYEGGQKLIIAHDTSSIANQEKQLQGTAGLLDALTAEQHLASLPGLYGQRVFISKFLQAYSQADPTVIKLSSMTVDSSNDLTVQGVANSYASVAKLARALAASNVTVGANAAASNQPYFSDVAISNLSFTPGTGVAFSLNAVLSSEVVSNVSQQ
jgi:hypothetical protein